MPTPVHRLLVVCAVASLGCILTRSDPANADNFGPSYYDPSANELVVTILYGGTNPNHQFKLKWGACQFDESGRRLPQANAEILDDEFNDTEQQQYTIVKRFVMADMPCPRPANVSVSTAPGFSFDLLIPK